MQDTTEYCQHRPTAGRKREALKMMVRLHLLACMAEKPYCGSVAQLGARASFKRGVAGSSPVATIQAAKAQWELSRAQSRHRG